MADEIRLGNTKLSLKLATSKTKELVRAGINGEKTFPELFRKYTWWNTRDYNMALIIVALIRYCSTLKGGKVDEDGVACVNKLAQKVFQPLKDGDGKRLKSAMDNDDFKELLNKLLGDAKESEKKRVIGAFLKRVEKITKWIVNGKEVGKTVDEVGKTVDEVGKTVDEAKKKAAARKIAEEAKKAEKEAAVARKKAEKEAAVARKKAEEAKKAEEEAVRKKAKATLESSSSMFYEYHMSAPSRSGNMKCLFGMDDEIGMFFDTTQSNIEKTREMLKKKFCQKHEMTDFTQESYDEADRKGVTFNDGGSAHGDHGYTFKSVEEKLDGLKRLETIKEYKYSTNYEPQAWIAVMMEKGFGDKQKILLYVPNGSYFGTVSDWDDYLDSMREVNRCKELSPIGGCLCGDAGIRPDKTTVPSNCKEKHTLVLWDDELENVKELNYCMLEDYLASYRK